MIKVLFVCHGNICRSPMAEFILKDIVKKNNLLEVFKIDSAATSREELNNDIYPPAKECLMKHNVPFKRHFARQINKDDLEYYDYIIAMEEYNVKNLQRVVGDSNKYSLLLDFTDTKGDISDPWYSGDFETAYNEIFRGCYGFFNSIIENK